MNKLMIAVACGALFAQNAVFGQAAQDPQLQSNAANAEVQAELDQPDGVAITVKPDGTFQIFIYDLFGTNDSHMIAHFGKMKEMVYDGLSTSKVSLTVRYKFNTTRSKYKGTGAGESRCHTAQVLLPPKTAHRSR